LRVRVLLKTAAWDIEINHLKLICNKWGEEYPQRSEFAKAAAGYADIL
jgi:hypothetical protein